MLHLMRMQTRFGSLSLLIIVSVIGAAAGLISTYAPSASADPETQTEHAEYHNAKLGFSLRYPASMTVLETDEDHGAQSVLFDSEQTRESFYILAIPYSQVDISADGFQPHDAYGLADQGLHLRDVNIIRGSNVQIWFVKLGVIYEVATAEGSEEWLVDILKTWQFD